MSETDRQAMTRGIDVEQLHTFITHASAHPEPIELERGEDIRTSVSTTFDSSVFVSVSFDLKDRDAGASKLRDFLANAEVGAKNLDDDNRERLQEMIPLSATVTLLSRAWDIESGVRGNELN